MAIEKLPATMIDGMISNDEAARYDAMLLAFRNQMLSGRVFDGMAEGMSDAFEDESGVDTVTSTNETYDTTNALYSPAIPAGYQADSAPSGTCYSNLDTPDTVHPEVNDENDGTWYGSSAIVPGSSRIWIDFGAGNDKHIRQISIWENVTAGARNCPDMELEYSSDGSTWYEAGAFSVAQNGSRQYFTFNASTTARYWALRYDANTYFGAGGGAIVSEIQMMEANSPLDMTLISEAGTADAQPTTAQIAIWEEDVDSITLPDDLKAYASCDDGSTWDIITLSEIVSLNTGRLLGGAVDLNGTGTSMVWKITTHNSKQLKVHACGLMWD
ncbi:MAG: hypothetical protein ISR47_03645 [Rhodospirillales bacterium]|nr:hypothetical protein [Rhodospirillales bacterium]